MLITPHADISTTAIAWAFGSGTVVIGTAVHAVAEMVAHKVNGLLFKRVRGRSIVPAVLKLLGDQTAREHVREVARGQAYEIFGVTRFVNQYARLYENLLNGAAPGAGITDSAVTTETTLF